MTEEQIKEYGAEIQRFGDWVVTTKGVLWGKAQPTEYFVYADELSYCGNAYGSDNVYDRLLDISGKTWLSLSEVDDLNEAYFHAVDRLSSEKRSKKETLAIQRGILAQRGAN